MSLNVSGADFTARLDSKDHIGIYENNAYVRGIVVDGLRSFVCNGKYIAALRSDRVDIYQCKNGAYVRTIDRKADSVQLSEDKIFLGVNGKTEQYSIDSGNTERVF